MYQQTKTFRLPARLIETLVIVYLLRICDMARCNKLFFCDTFILFRKDLDVINQMYVDVK